MKLNEDFEYIKVGLGKLLCISLIIIVMINLLLIIYKIRKKNI